MEAAPITPGVHLVTRGYLDHQVAESAAPEFGAREPFPWIAPRASLRPAGFEELRRDYPPPELFERHQDIPRHHGQRPHNRYYLACEESPYGRLPGEPGCVAARSLAASWQRLLQEFDGAWYRNFVARLLETNRLHLHFSWHMAGSGDAVSPHCDSARRLGTHIFNFNSPDDWDPAWGGQTVLLGDPTDSRPDPSLGDFRVRHPIEYGTNRSLLFQNGENHWHGVSPLQCPPGALRKVFLVAFLRPERRLKVIGRRLRDRAMRWL